MGIYSEQVLPRVLNVMSAAGESKELRQRACAGLHGEVVELGFGSGLNVPHYPAAVTHVHAIEPSGVAWKLASNTSLPQRSQWSGRGCRSRSTPAAA